MLRKWMGAVSLMGTVAGTAWGFSAGVAAQPAPTTQNAPTRALIDIDAALNSARIEGLGDQIELVVPLPVDEAGRRLGAIGRAITYKGVCGEEGAIATPQQLFEHARRDLERRNAGQRGSATVIYGESPRFVVTYDPLDIALQTLFLPNFAEACEYVASQLDDRIDIYIDLQTDDIDGNVIGSAGSTTYSFSYQTYVQGLRAADNREPEDPNFANALPSATLPVRYDGSATTTNESVVVANATQIRAIFGDNALDHDSDISITLDNTADWDYFVYADNTVESGHLSLVDVAVHEITHGLGYRSQIARGGTNANNRMSGLDLARFRGFPAVPIGIEGGMPSTVAQFTVFPRLGDNIPLSDPNYYSRVNASNLMEYIELEGGDTSTGGLLLQPSHLAHKSNFADKLGLMDPIISRGTTYGPVYWGSAELGPIDDMGWKLVRAADLVGDCNGNGVFDFIDIINGARDADGDWLMDVCEVFYDDISPAGHYVNASTQTVYDSGGVTSLANFFPGSATVLIRNKVTTVDADYTPSDAGTVRVFSGVVFAPAADEYAFRIEHEDDALLEIAGQQFFRPGEGDLIGSLNDASLPIYIQLEAGWHSFEYTVLITESGPIRLARESRSLGGWGAIPTSDLGGTFFDDCNGNGIDDQFDIDSDGDGIPDDCEEPDCDNDGIPDDEELDCDGNGVPDDCEPRGDFVNVFDAGVIGTDQEMLKYGTCDSPEGFRFDTEMAIWDSNGDLVATNDDTLEPCSTNRLSRLDLQLPAGEYYLGITGYDMLFSDGFGVEPGPGTVCSAGGAYFVSFGTAATVIADVDSGKVKVFRFTIEESLGCQADLAAPFGTLNFFDVSTFMSLFNAGDPGADFAVPFGSLNFFDVSAFISAYNAGCP